MAQANGIRAGQCFVEIHANDTHFQRGMVLLSNRMQLIGQRLRNFGAGLGLGAAAIGAPIIGALRATSAFEDALLELKAASGDISADQLRAVHDESLRLAQTMGVGPERIAQSFAMLIKAGMTVEDALGGAAKAAVEFAQVSGVDAEAAAVFMKTAMNVFGVSATEAVDTLSSAADASETSIASMVQGFSLVSSAGVTFNQTLFGISQAMALLARYGIQGEEAGTGLKVLLSRLVAPSGEAEKALAKYNLTVKDFRDNTGKLLPMAQIVEVFSKRMADVSQILNDRMLVDVFGDRGIKVIGAFVHSGRRGFEDLAKSMENNRSVSAKFSITMSGISGFFTKINTAVKLLSIGFAESLSPSLNEAGDSMIRLASAMGEFLRANPMFAQIVTYGTAAAGAIAAFSFVVGNLFTGVAYFLAVGVHFLRWFGSLGQAAGGAATAVGGVGLALQGLLRFAGVLGLILTGWQVGMAIGRSLFGMQGEATSTLDKQVDGGMAKVTVPQDLEPMQGGQGGGFGANHGTFMGGVAEQIGIGPSLDSSARTANATERAADGIEDMVGMMQDNRAVAPNAADLQAGMAAAWQGAGGIDPSRRDMVDAAEKTALESKRTNELLAALVRLAGEGQIAFA
jgi:TP901 family phage tail tape measure protein